MKRIEIERPVNHNIAAAKLAAVGLVALIVAGINGADFEVGFQTQVESEALGVIEGVNTDTPHIAYFEHPMYAIGVAKQDETIWSDPYAYMLTDTTVKWRYDTSSLSYEWTGSKVLVTSHEGEGGIDLSKTIVEPKYGSVCEAEIQDGTPVFVCDDLDSGEAKLGLYSNPGQIASNPDILRQAYIGMEAMANDSYCVIRHLLEVRKVTPEDLFSATLRNFLYAHFGLPPEMVAVEFSSDGQGNFASRRPFPEEFAELKEDWPNLQNPFNIAQAGTDGDLPPEGWCAATVDINGQRRPIIDTAFLTEVMDEARHSGRETVEHGALPGGIIDVEYVEEFMADFDPQNPLTARIFQL